MHPLSRDRCRAKAGLSFTANGVKYETLGKIGNGAAGLVRKAKVKSSGQIVAVKFLAPDPKYIDPDAFDEVAVRFKREGMRGAGLDHENLIKVIAYEDNEDGKCFEKSVVKNPFFIMEYVQGRTLESLIRHLSMQEVNHAFLNEQTLTVAVCVSRALE